MTDNLENSVLEHLRTLRAGQDRIESGLKEVKQRLTGVDQVLQDLDAITWAFKKISIVNKQ